MTDREKLVELIEQVYYCSIEELADHLLANGVIVLPCKVGDEVWGIRSYHGVKHPQQGRIVCAECGWWKKPKEGE